MLSFWAPLLALFLLASRTCGTVVAEADAGEVPSEESTFVGGGGGGGDVAANRPRADRKTEAGEERQRRLWNDLPPVKMVITNMWPIIETWQVYEVEFYIGYCFDNKKIPGAPYSPVYSTGGRPEFPEDIPEHAVDGQRWTRWTAQCFGGCEKEEAYVGVDISEIPEWGKAQTEPNKTWADYRVRCVRFYQSKEPEFMSEIIAVQEVYEALPAKRHETIMTINAAAGVWSRRPAFEDTLWRLVNLGDTLWYWAVSEVEFYRDQFCEMRIGPGTPTPAGPFTSGSRSLENHNGRMAFDGKVDTSWIANCITPIPNASQKGCGLREAFLGLDFGDEAVTVKCLRFRQAPWGPGGGSATRTNSYGFSLERWDSQRFKEAERYWDPLYWSNEGRFIILDVDDYPTQVTPYLGTYNATDYFQTHWEDTRPPDRAAVRLSNDEYTKDRWIVHELQFFEAENCTGLPVIGESISMQGPQEANVSALAFDDDYAPENFWVSSCTTFLNNNESAPGACGRQEAWIGLYFRPVWPDAKMPTVRCFQLMQTRTQLRQATSVNLWFWLGGEWKEDSNHRDIGGGWWNRRPALPFSMWRAVNMDAAQLQWRVMELKAYRDPMCLNETTAGVPIGSGNMNYNDHIRQAFDDSTMTSWGADCDVCWDQGKYWIGNQLPWLAEDSEQGMDLVRCIRIWQSPTKENQVNLLRIDIWSGRDWLESPFAPNGVVAVSGGGHWLRQPVIEFGMWRLIPEVGSTNSVWRLSEVEFYADPDCRHRLRMPSSTGGTSFTLTGYERELFSRTDGFSEGQFAVDNDPTTGVLILHEPDKGRPAWFAFDFNSDKVWVRCVRIQQGALSPEQHATVRLETWDGFRNFTEPSPHLLKREIVLEGLGGGGWQRRPAAPKTLWRLENLDFVPEGWVVKEAQFHTDPACGTTGNWSGLGEYYGPEAAISSGFVPFSGTPMNRFGPHKAFDEDPSTAWLSQCCEIPDVFQPRNMPRIPLGCAPREAWLGLDLGYRPQEVRCVRLLHTGYRRMQSFNVALAAWTGQRFKDVWYLNELGGSTWNQRPAGPNTMWRVVYNAPKLDKCYGALNRDKRRTWGIAELEFYSDSSCDERIEFPGKPIGSGTVDTYRHTMMDGDNYHMANAIDGDEETVWAANCLLGWNHANVSRVDCVGEWLGVDFGARAVEVRCMRIQQSRFESQTCCDPAEELQLQRWNGTKWLEALWRHDPPKRAIEKYRYMGATFVDMGKCPSYSSDLPIFMAKEWEKRTRRDSDNCIVPLTGATTLLGDKYCIKHPACVSVFGPAGNCCPVGDGKTSESRCCCSFLQPEAIYVDEFDPHPSPWRRDFKAEFTIIVISDYLPWLGLFLSVVTYVIANLYPRNAYKRMLVWSAKPFDGWSCCSRMRRLVAWILWPSLAWRSWLDKGHGIPSKLCCWLVLPGPKRTTGQATQQLWRLPLWLAFGTWAAGGFVYIVFGIVAGNVLLKVLLFASLIVRVATSPFNPKDEKDMKMRKIISGVQILKGEDTASNNDLLVACVGGVILGFGYFFKFLFDLFVLRAQMISYNAIDPIEADKLVDIFPGLMKLLQEPATLVWRILDWSNGIMAYATSFVVGIPKCQGSCVLLASVALTMVLVLVCQWLNYDLFGIFAGARQSVKTTRPECQRILITGGVLASLAFQFAAVQCGMLLFSRAVSLANPVASRVWMCDYQDFSAVLIGRGFLLFSALTGLVYVFLCANGHFLGCKYLVRDVAKNLNLKLEGLDPANNKDVRESTQRSKSMMRKSKSGLNFNSESSGDMGSTMGSLDSMNSMADTQTGGVRNPRSWVRFDTFLSAVPTLFGCWFDSWNIKGYIVKERARVYSEQLRDPQPCQQCGEVHVKYANIMTATGRQVSLAMQLLPYGTLIGKGAEYFNDPPLLYCGKELTCFRPVSVVPMEKYPDLGRGQMNTRLLLLCAYFCAILKEFGNPLLRRLLSVVMWSLMIAGCFTVTEDNLLTWGANLVRYGFLVGMAKGLSEFCFDIVLSWLLGVLYAAISEAEGQSVDLKSGIVRTVCGQALVGAALTCVVVVVLQDSGAMSSWPAIFLSGVLGYIWSLGVLVVQVALEMPPKEQDDPPLTAAGSTLAKAGVAALAAYIMCQVALVTVEGRVAMGVAIIVAAVQVFVMKMVLLERTPREKTNTAKERSRWKDSASIMAVRTQKFLPGMTAIFTTSLTASIFADAWGSDSFSRLVTSLATGLPTALILAISVNRFQDQTPQLVGFFSGVFVWAVVQAWSLMVGIFAGALTFGIVGSILEEREVQKKYEDMAREMEEREAAKEELRLRGFVTASTGIPDDLSDVPPRETREEKFAMALERNVNGEEVYEGANEARYYGKSKKQLAALGDGQAEELRAAARLALEDNGHGTRLAITTENLAALRDQGETAEEDLQLTLKGPDALRDAALADSEGNELAVPAADNMLRSAEDGRDRSKISRISKSSKSTGRGSGLLAAGTARSNHDAASVRSARTARSTSHQSESPSGRARGAVHEQALVATQGASRASSSAAASAGQQVALIEQPFVDNFSLERHNEDEEEQEKNKPSPAVIGWDDPDEAPTEKTLHGRWDHGVPKAAKSTRKVHAAPVRPSSLGALRHTPGSPSARTWEKERQSRHMKSQSLALAAESPRAPEFPSPS